MTMITFMIGIGGVILMIMGCTTVIFGFQLHKEAIKEIIYERWRIGWKDFVIFTVIALFVDIAGASLFYLGDFILEHYL